MSGLKRNRLTEEKSWANLKELHAKFGKTLVMRQMFAEDSERFNKYKFLSFPFISN